MKEIGLWYISGAVQDDIVNEFVSSISVSNFSVSVERVEEYPIQAGIEWLAPTALIIFITKPYFQSFLSEMGKDHYNLLKKALKVVANQLLGRFGPKIRRIAIGEPKRSEKYSMAFSIYVDVSDKLNLKLLFPTGLNEDEIYKTIDAYSVFIEDLYEEKLDETIIKRLSNGRIIGKTMLIAYDMKTKELGPVDPVPQKHN